MYNVGVFGATGAVGREFIDLLVDRKFPIKNLRLFSSSRSAGTQLQCGEQQVTVEDVAKADFSGIDIALFSMGSGPSKDYAPKLVEAGALVIDNSSAFRMDEGIPLVVPEVNPEAALAHKGIIANPNCSTIQMVVALKVLHDLSPLKRVIVSTYQAVSGTGAAAVAELESQVKAWVNSDEIGREVYPKQIAFNLFPHIDVFTENGYTKEEMKMVNETHKIMSLPGLPISATCVRVPVFRAHSEAIWVETERKISVQEAQTAFAKAEGITLVDEREPGGYPTPLDVTKKYDVFVGRVRDDLSSQNGLSFWIVADQLYKGAALNAIQIAEDLISRQALLPKAA